MGINSWKWGSVERRTVVSSESGYFCLALGDSNSILRGPGRPRLRPIGPANQEIRGSRPDRPPST